MTDKLKPSYLQILAYKCATHEISSVILRECFTGNIIPCKNDASSPFNTTTEGIDEGKFEEGWIVDYYREPFDKIFDSLDKYNGKVIRTGIY